MEAIRARRNVEGGAVQAAAHCRGPVWQQATAAEAVVQRQMQMWRQPCEIQLQSALTCLDVADAVLLPLPRIIVAGAVGEVYH